VRLPQAVVVALWPCLLGWCWALGLAGLAAVLPWLATHGACSVNDKLIKETQLVWIKSTRSRAECYTHDT
jgi:hypothetical protein